MARAKLRSADEAASLVRSGSAVAVTGGGGGLVEPDTLLRGIERRFLRTGAPRDLTLVHALGLGDRDRRGVNRFAHRGMVRRVIGGHWVWSPRMQEMAQLNEIEAYVLPAGVIVHLMREIGAGRPGLITHVGLGTFVDPRVEGGKMNDLAQEDLVELVRLDGRTLLRYLPFPVGAACIRGTFADAAGNVSLEEEGATLDALALALAAHNTGGRVLVQVREEVPVGSLPARSVAIPGTLVDAVVVDPQQQQSYSGGTDLVLSGSRPPGDGNGEELPDLPFDQRLVIARRAARELRDGDVLNFGFGIPDGVAGILARRRQPNTYHQTIEQGIYGGSLLSGTLFGFARAPTAMIDSPSQFDFYSGGGLDVAFLGMGEVDRHGNVNVSRLQGAPVGPGGFVDIAQNSRRVVFCGTLEAKGARVVPGDGRLRIERYGQVRKFVRDVAQITFSGDHALRVGQDVLYVTERAVFRLTGRGIVLEEVAPGVDLRADVLERMDFSPLMPSPPAVMDAGHFFARPEKGQ